MMIDGGTTNLQLVKMIPSDFQATIVTNSPTIAQQFNHHPQVEVIVVGGRYFKPSDVLTGPAACEMIRSIYADICFLGICSLHHIQGITTQFYEEAQVKKAMVFSSQHVVALTHAEKLGQCDNFKICDTQGVSTIITELNPEEEKLDPYKQLQISIL
jgi:DeoR/GlpR family transcriptional regulator of sugar metabolism